jgi:hypothetical protein
MSKHVFLRNPDFQTRNMESARFEPHSTPRVNVGKICYAVYNIIHGLPGPETLKPPKRKVS